MDGPIAALAPVLISQLAFMDNDKVDEIVAGLKQVVNYVSSDEQ